jgi:nucleotide-binding universal stress UspA family protein
MDTGMYRHLLIATDGSELSNKAVEQGLSIAKAFNSKVTIVTVTEPWMMSAPGEVAVVFPVEQYEKAAAVNASNILKDAAAVGAKDGIACETVHVRDQFPAEAIVDTAKAKGLRPDRDVIPWPSGTDAARARQSGPSCCNAQSDTRTHMPIKSPGLNCERGTSPAIVPSIITILIEEPEAPCALGASQTH